MFYLPVAGFFLWFVYTLFLIFLIVPFFNTKIKRLILFGIAIILFLIPYHFTELFCLSQFKNQLIYFVIGIIVFEWKDIRGSFSKFSFSIPLLLFIITYYLKDRFIDGGVLLKIVSFFVALLGILVTSNISKYIANKEFRLRDILLKIAAVTYTIYLFHTTFEGFTKAILMKIPLIAGQENNFSFIVSALIIISIGLFGPILLDTFIISRSKILCYLFGVKYKTLTDK